MKVIGGISSQNGRSLEVLHEIRNRQPTQGKEWDAERIKGALHLDEYPRELPERPDLKALADMAAFVNNTRIHYSGNCAVLAAAFHYNALNRLNILSVENTSSPFVGFESQAVHEIVFGGRLKGSCCLHSLREVTEEVLRRHEVDGEMFFIVAAEDYYVGFLEVGHDFNAVILLDDNGTPHVQFVDAWKTSDTMPSADRLINRFPANSHFYVYS